MEQPKNRFPWLGVVLILFGAALLVKKLGYLDVSFHEVFWPFIMLLGLVGVGRGFSRGRRGKIFFGALAFLYAVYFFLNGLDQFDIAGHLMFGSSFVIFGIAFFMVWLNDLRDWYFLIPAVLSGGVGAALFISELGYLSQWEVLDAVHVYWPLALILFGLGMVLRRRIQHAPTEPPAGAA